MHGSPLLIIVQTTESKEERKEDKDGKMDRHREKMGR